MYTNLTVAALILSLQLMAESSFAISCKEIFAKTSNPSASTESSGRDRERLNERLRLSRKMREEHFSDRVFDAQGNIRKHLRQILLEYRLHGNVHVINTGIEGRDALLSIMNELGFTGDRNFTLGGRASSETQSKWVEGDVLRNLDYYPPELYLLPNTEVQYHSTSPRDVLFFVEAPPRPDSGGRIFLHNIREIAHTIAGQVGGKELLKVIRETGLRIDTGFVDARHPQRKQNYFKSWQELSGKDDVDAAVAELKLRNGEYHNVWKVQDNTSSPTYTVMTSVSIPGFRSGVDGMYLNIPRIALTDPAFENGYRRFLLGNGQELTEQQNQILMTALLKTRNGSDLHKGDLFLVDNVRTAHSREAFDKENNPRKILVGMSGVHIAENLSERERHEIHRAYHREHFIPIWDLVDPSASAELPKGVDVKEGLDLRYRTPPAEVQMREQFSMQVYNAKHRDLADPKVAAEIKAEFAKHGRLHIINNKHVDGLPEAVLKALGFGVDEQFKWGGKDSGRTVRTALGNGFHTVDKYPSGLPLLAHNEILYQRVLPERLLFHYRKVSGNGYGGRTLVHSAKNTERLLRESGEEGAALLYKLRKHGQLIRTGFLDENHPAKEANFVRSWQDRFGTTDIDEAVKICRSQRSHFDRCWKVKLPEKSATGSDVYMLMTDVKIPMFKKDPRDGRSYMMFPRIAYDSPSIINGFREFLIGNGKDFTPGERTLMLQAFWQTREGIYQSPGDILLVDNIRYGHSREPYREVDDRGKPLLRSAGVVMAGKFYTDDTVGRKMSKEP